MVAKIRVRIVWSRQKIWNLKPEINFTESLKMQVNFSGPKKYIAPTESFEGDILKDVNDVEAEEAAGTGSDVVFVSNVDVVNNPYHFESVTQYVVIPKDEIEAKSAEGEVSVEKSETLPEEIATSDEVADDIKDEIESASQSSHPEEGMTTVEGEEASSEEIFASEDVDDVIPENDNMDRKYFLFMYSTETERKKATTTTRHEAQTWISDGDDHDGKIVYNRVAIVLRPRHMILKSCVTLIS